MGDGRGGREGGERGEEGRAPKAKNGTTAQLPVAVLGACAPLSEGATNRLPTILIFHGGPNFTCPSCSQIVTLPHSLRPRTPIRDFHLALPSFVQRSIVCVCVRERERPCWDLPLTRSRLCVVSLLGCLPPSRLTPPSAMP